MSEELRIFVEMWRAFSKDKDRVNPTFNESMAARAVADAYIAEYSAAVNPATIAQRLTAIEERLKALDEFLRSRLSRTE